VSGTLGQPKRYFRQFRCKVNAVNIQEETFGYKSGEKTQYIKDLIK